MFFRVVVLLDLDDLVSTVKVLADREERVEVDVKEIKGDYQNVVGQDSLTRFDKKQGGEHRRFERRDRGGREGYRNGGRRVNGQQSNEHRSNNRNRRGDNNE